MHSKTYNACTFYLYKTLGLQNNANATDITAEYKKRIVRHHPDSFPGASDIAKSVQHAYEVLSKQNTRNIYDMFCQHIMYAPDSVPSSDNHLYVYPKPAWVTQKNDIVYIMDISLKNLYHGKKTTVRTKDINLEIDIPKDVTDGQRITFSGRGLKTTPDSTPGDLVIIINRVDYPHYHTIGCDLHCLVEVDHRIAQSGGQLFLIHPTGNIISLVFGPGEIPKPGYQKMLTKFGLPNGNQVFGNLYVKFLLYFPYANVTINT